jgi:hypothetical protein
MDRSEVQSECADRSGGERRICEGESRRQQRRHVNGAKGGGANSFAQKIITSGANGTVAILSPSEGNHRRWPMANYRFYVLDKHDHVREPPQVFECRDDEAAVENAVRLLNGQVIEVWDHSRRVVRLEPAGKRMLDAPTDHGRRGEVQSHAYDSD